LALTTATATKDEDRVDRFTIDIIIAKDQPYWAIAESETGQQLILYLRVPR
jgi:hypothetical protein